MSLGLIAGCDPGHDLNEIRFVLFGEAMYNVWAEVADDLFG